jgi:hypothetical protein
VLSLVVLTIVGGGMMVTMASTNTVLQTIVEERLRGRVMAFYAMAFLARRRSGVSSRRPGRPIGPTNTVTLGGLACIRRRAWFASAPKFRASRAADLCGARHSAGRSPGVAG